MVLIPDDLMSSKSINKAELRISPWRERGNKGLIHLLKPTDILQSEGQRESEEVKSFVTECKGNNEVLPAWEWWSQCKQVGCQLVPDIRQSVIMQRMYK